MSNYDAGIDKRVMVSISLVILFAGFITIAVADQMDTDENPCVYSEKWNEYNCAAPGAAGKAATYTASYIMMFIGGINVVRHL